MINSCWDFNQSGNVTSGYKNRLRIANCYWVGYQFLTKVWIFGVPIFLNLTVTTCAVECEVWQKFLAFHKINYNSKLFSKSINATFVNVKSLLFLSHLRLTTCYIFLVWAAQYFLNSIFLIFINVSKWQNLKNVESSRDIPFNLWCNGQYIFAYDTKKLKSKFSTFRQTSRKYLEQFKM